MTTRILLRGGLIADGIGATTRRADLLIEGETIASIRDVAVTDAAEHPERTYSEPPPTSRSSTWLRAAWCAPVSSTRTRTPRDSCWSPGSSTARSPRA